MYPCLVGVSASVHHRTCSTAGAAPRNVIAFSCPPTHPPQSPRNAFSSSSSVFCDHYYEFVFREFVHTWIHPPTHPVYYKPWASLLILVLLLFLCLFHNLYGIVFPTSKTMISLVFNTQKEQEEMMTKRLHTQLRRSRTFGESYTTW